MRQLGRSARTRLLIGASAAAILCGGGNAALAQEKPAITIAPQPLAQALYEFGGKTGAQVIFASGLASAKQSGGVAGESDERLALAQLLEGTGLTFRRDGDIFVIIDAEGGSDPQSQGAAGDGADGTVEALIVTAQKREEDIQDVPIAISAFTQETLERTQVAGGPDLMTQVPNMTFTKTNFSGYSVQIRGIGTQAISATTDPAVAVAFNNTPFIRNRFFEQEFYDLARVEVLRGPQGTLYGRNATAGVVNIISAKPSFNVEAKLSGDVANYNSTRVEGMVNLPLVEDKVALRLAGAWTKREGFVTNQIDGDQTDGRDLWSTRLSLRFAPTDALDVNLIWEHFQEDDDRIRSGKQLCHKDTPTTIGGLPVDDSTFTFGGHAGRPTSTYTQGCLPVSMYSPEAFETPNGYALPYYAPFSQLSLPIPYTDPYVSATQSRDLRVIEATIDPRYKAKSDLVEVQVGLDLGSDLTLASETAYSTDFIWSLQDFNRFNTKPGAWFADNPAGLRPGLLTNDNTVFCDAQLGCSDRLMGIDISTAKSRHFSQEFRLSSDYDGAFNFSLGANFLRYDTEDKYYVMFNSLGLWAAHGYGDGPMYEQSPYVPGVTDNQDCADIGFPAGERERFYFFINCIYIDPNPIESLNDEGHQYFLSRNPYKLISYAAFGEAYYQVTPSLKITGGLRFTVDRKEAPQIPSWLLAAQTRGYPVAEVYREEWREPTGRLTIDWRPDLAMTDETMLYASYAHGYKAGGSNPPPPIVLLWVPGDFAAPIVEDSLSHPKTFDAEFVDAFELGSKNTLLGGALTLNANVFYYDYKGYQISQIVNRSAINLNIDAEVWGAEIEANWRPLENLKVAFKGGFENTRIADGVEAIDLMDRTAGMPGWVVARPFPSIPSNCILPVSVVIATGEVSVPNGSNGNVGPCINAYALNLDPVTLQPYEPDPYPGLPDYPGFDPSTAPNNGEGFSKDLSGNELPNAPNFTGTLSLDYTLPLPQDWMVTLHSDFYYQSEAWARIFNTDGYDKIKAYNNINVAALFRNEEAGWLVMAYVKNVLDRDAITGTFLNSDDTGLTTNVFLNEPRLYGLRVTKQWSGGFIWGGANANRDPNLPYPLTVELGGSVLRHEADYMPATGEFADIFSPQLHTDKAQARDLDWGDGRELKLTYASPASAWRLWASLRSNEANGLDKAVEQEILVACLFAQSACEASPSKYIRPVTYSRTTVRNKEEHTLADFMVGREFGLGSLDARSTLSLGLRYASFQSETDVQINGMVHSGIPVEQAIYYMNERDGVAATFTMDREASGFGPAISWDAAKTLFGSDETGRVDLEVSVGGAVLFGRQEAFVNGQFNQRHWEEKYVGTRYTDAPPLTDVDTEVGRRSSDSATIPMAHASVGLSYEIQRLKVSAGYRMDRAFDVLDGGYLEETKVDRTIDGPYFKLSVGFGG